MLKDLEKETTKNSCVSVFISWEDFAEYIGLYENWDLCDPNEEINDEIRLVAFTEAQQSKKSNKIELENEICKSITEHWSPKKIITKFIDFKKLFTKLNEISNYGAIDIRLFGFIPKTGDCIEYIAHNDGITFTLLEPFIIPFYEVFYKKHGKLPSADISNISKERLIKFFQLILPNIYDINLDSWDFEREVLT